VARARRSFVRSGKRPNRSWAGAVAAAAVTVPAASKVLLTSLTLSNPGIDETVLRTVGGVGVASDQSAATETQTGAIGFGVFNSTAIALGVTGLPDPVTDAKDDVWFMHISFFQTFLLKTAVGVIADQTHWYPFDSSAKRIVSNGYGIAVVAANAHASNGLTVGLNYRLLNVVRGTG